MNVHTELIQFATREARSIYIADRFRDYLTDSLLDVGCYEAPLRSILSDVKYTGIDIAGNPDVKLDLEACMSLPFEADQFRTVICIDVLEHLNNFHTIFSELIRVARNYVIISLPNAWRDARRPIEKGKGEFGHYGLQMATPEDRHKWFFSFSQAKEFLVGQAHKNELNIKEMFATEKPKPWITRSLRKLRYPGERYNNRYTQTIWTVLEK